MPEPLKFKHMTNFNESKKVAKQETETESKSTPLTETENAIEIENKTGD
jgi:hypothetical protein